MKAHIPAMSRFVTPAMREMADLLTENGWQIRMVGGAVRDILLERGPKDFDFATDARPEYVQALFENAGYTVIPVGIDHGTVAVRVRGEQFEITTLRVDAETDGRHAKVAFTNDWREDALRRDFTINAMSMDLDGNLYDYFDGHKHIQEKHVTFVGDADQRIKEDYLRILRFFRFRAKLSVGFDHSDIVAISKNASGLRQISGERIWMEMQKILTGPYQNIILHQMQTLGVLDALDLPPMDTTAAWIAYNSTNNPVTILAAGLDDDIDVAEHIIDRWKLSRKEASLLRFLVKEKREYGFEKLRSLDIADAKWFLDRMAEPHANREHIEELAAMAGLHHTARVLRRFTIPEFPVSGDDLIARGMEPGPELGERLHELRQRWKQSNFVLTKEELLKNA